MHIPNEMLGGAVCPLTAGLATAGVLAAVRAAAKTADKPAPLYFAAVAGLVFAAQMLNFPVAGGTSGHLLGGMLAVATLGLSWGVLAMSLVLAVQTLLFGDGGLAQLGANVLNMALIGGGAAGWLWQRLPRMNQRLSLALAAFASTLLAALACSVELAAAGTLSFAVAAPAMLGVHALIGIGEALLTVALVALLDALKPASAHRLSALPQAVPLFLLLLAPFASPLPDGLEWVAAQYAQLKAVEPAFVAPLADYAFPLFGQGALATLLAGLAGVLSLLALGWGGARLLGAGRG